MILSFHGDVDVRPDAIVLFQWKLGLSGVFVWLGGYTELEEF